MQVGQSARRIARDVVVDRKTAGVTSRRRVLRLLASGRRVMRRSSRSACEARPAPSEAWTTLEGQRTRIEAWLRGDRPLRVVRAFSRAMASTSGTRRSVASRTPSSGWRERAVTVRVDDPPFGKEAQDGFRPRRPFDAAWRFFEGVPARIVPDNTPVPQRSFFCTRRLAAPSSIRLAFGDRKTSRASRIVLVARRRARMPSADAATLLARASTVRHAKCRAKSTSATRSRLQPAPTALFD
jgi:hypothetical protein